MQLPAPTGECNVRTTNSDLDSNRGSHGCKPSAATTEVSLYPNSLVVIYMVLEECKYSL